jgi:hypothetical protein
MVDKIENALGETRILVLVVQVILGFQYQSFFQPGFDKLPGLSVLLRLGSFGMMLLALALLLSPAAFHRIVERGELTKRFLRFITRVAMPALLPFALALGADFYVVGTKIGGPAAGLAGGVSASLTALFFWFGLEALTARDRTQPPSPKENTTMEESPSSLKDKVKFVLTEVRVVLPGAQALLGFQFAAVMMESFDRLPASARAVHVVSLACVALATILLMAPAAFHRIVEEGEATERMHRFGSRCLLGAMAFLAPGVCGGVFVVVLKALHSSTGAIAAATVSLIAFYGWWFGYMLYRRAERPSLGARAESSASLPHAPSQ